MQPEFGIVMSHAPGISQFWEQMPLDRRAPLDRAYAALHDELVQHKPDVILAFLNDHYRSFTLANYPAFCIGVGDVHDVPMAGGAEILRVPQRRFRGDPELAMHILNSLFEEGFDPSYSAELNFFDDLSTPMRFLYPGSEAPDVAIVPIMTNCIAPPCPPMKRCHALGLAVRRALERFPGAPRRVVLLGTGGLSHSVGTPTSGAINEPFDRNIITLVAQGQYEEMLDWNDAEIERQGGNGALELRNWVETLAAMGAYRARPLAYVPAYEWITGCAAVALDPAPAPSGAQPPRERAGAVG